MNQENRPQIHEQNMWNISPEKTGIFSASNLSKITPIILLLIFGAWYANSYFSSVRADEFVKIYNPNIEIIASDMQAVGENFQKISDLYMQSAWETQISETDIANIELSTQVILTENETLYERITKSSNIIESEACPILKNSESECIEFISLYNEIVSAFQNDEYEKSTEISSQMFDASNIFITAVKKDNIEF